MAPHAPHAPHARDLLLAGGLGALIHFPWELGHSALYEGAAELSWREHLVCCGLASLLDGAGTAALFGVGAYAFREPRWTRNTSPLRIGFTLALGLAGAAVTEWAALAFGWWRYGPIMPELPGTGLGLTPLLQFMALPVVTLFVGLPYLWSEKADGEDRQ